MPTALRLKARARPPERYQARPVVRRGHRPARRACGRHPGAFADSPARHADPPRQVLAEHSRDQQPLVIAPRTPMQRQDDRTGSHLGILNPVSPWPQPGCLPPDVRSPVASSVDHSWIRTPCRTRIGGYLTRVLRQCTESRHPRRSKPGRSRGSRSRGSGRPGLCAGSSRSRGRGTTGLPRSAPRTQSPATATRRVDALGRSRPIPRKTTSAQSESPAYAARKPGKNGRSDVSRGPARW